MLGKSIKEAEDEKLTTASSRVMLTSGVGACNEHFSIDYLIGKLSLPELQRGAMRVISTSALWILGCAYAKISFNKAGAVGRASGHWSSRFGNGCTLVPQDGATQGSIF